MQVSPHSGPAVKRAGVADIILQLRCVHRQGMLTEIVVPDVIHEKPLQFGYELCLAYE
jgi:hypothetical protein